MQHTARNILVVLMTLTATLSSSTAAAPLGCGLVPVECEAWRSIFDGGMDDLHPDVVASPDGERVFVVTTQDSAYGRLVGTQAYDVATGTLLWNTTYAKENIPYANGISVSPDGARLHVIGTGFTGPYARIPQMFLLTYDAHDGTLLWMEHQEWYTEGEALAVSHDGSTLYAAGARQQDYALTAYNATTGAPLWVASYDGEGGYAGWRGWSYDVAFDVAISRDGTSLYVTGVSATSNALLEYATMAIAAEDGTTRWVARLSATDLLTGADVSAEAYDVEVSPDGSRVYVLGTAGAYAYDAGTGASAWADPLTAVRCRPYMPMFYHECVLRVSPDGRGLFAFSHNDLAAYETDKGGTRWHLVLRVGSDIHGFGRGMVMSPDGTRVYLTTPGGRDNQVTDSISSISTTVETQAFDAATGGLAWRVTHGYHHVASGIDVAPDGSRVYVTSTAYPGTGPPNISTVAYDTELGLDNLPAASI